MTYNILISTYKIQNDHFQSGNKTYLMWLYVYQRTLWYKHLNITIERRLYFNNNVFVCKWTLKKIYIWSSHEHWKLRYPIHFYCCFSLQSLWSPVCLIDWVLLNVQWQLLPAYSWREKVNQYIHRTMQKCGRNVTTGASTINYN
jgi:hypothetical protein